VTGIRTVLMRESARLLTSVGPGLGDKEAINRITDHFESGDAIDLIFALSMTQSGCEQSQALAMYRWAESGFPVITMGHRFAAAVALTSATEEVVDYVRPPFRGYILEVPDGIVTMINPVDKQAEDIRHVLVLYVDNSRMRSGFSWSYNAISESNHVLYRYGVASRELLPPDIGQVALEGGFGQSYLVTEHDQRACSIIGRLIVNTALAMSDPRNVEQPHQGRVRHRVNSAFNGRTQPDPVCRTYVLGRDIKLSSDLRPELRRYLAGNRKSLNVQVLVSGHYKMQPYGPSSKLRKLIWLEPYWRGPVDAPIPIRSHVLG